MILKRLAVTITLTIRGKGVVDKETTPDQLKAMIWNVARRMSKEKFVENIGLWHTMTGQIEEDELKADSVDKLDRAIVHQIHVDNAKEILCSEATIRALVMTFSVLTTTGARSPAIDDSNLKLDG